MIRHASPLAAVLLALVLMPMRVATVAAQEAAPPPPSQLVRVQPIAPLTIAPGATAEVSITFDVEPTWHVNANKPNEDFLVPTVLSLPAAAGVRAGTVRYPAAHQVTLSFSETPLAVYEGTATIVVSLVAAADAAPGPRTIAGTLRFQGCNDQVCLPPAAVPVRIAVTVAGDPVAAAPGRPTPSIGAEPEPVLSAMPADSTPPPIAGFETAPPPGGAAAAPRSGAGATGDNLVGRWFAERGTAFAFLLIFLMGLALNLTPCVYPMMGVTVSLFGAGAANVAEKKRGVTLGGSLRALPRALVYVLGIALMYSTLGVIAALTGGFFGGWLASPWVLGGIGLLLLALSLSMFGFYEIQAPGALLSKLGGATGAGFLGTFLAGLLVGVFAAPCIGAPIIALLAHVGAKGDPVFGFQAFFVLSLGLGLPYLLLAVFSGLMTRLPRSGAWMQWVKHLFGVILLGVAAFYLTLAIAPKQVGWVVPAALGLGGLFLGFLEPTGRDRPAFRRFKWAVGVAAIVAAVLIVFRPVAPSIEWSPFDEAALAAAREQGAPVMLEFSADWCVPCHELDDVTFTDPAVVRATAGYVRMKVDMTRFDSAESQALRERFAVAGVPTVLFLGVDGTEIPAARVVGFMRPGPFLERVRLADGAATAAAR